VGVVGSGRLGCQPCVARVACVCVCVHACACGVCVCRYAVCVVCIPSNVCEENASVEMYVHHHPTWYGSPAAGKI